MATGPLLTTFLIRRLRIDSLANRLPWQITPLSLYAALFIIIDFGFVNTYVHFFVERPHGLLANPFSVAIPIGILTAAVSIQYMTDQYRNALKEAAVPELGLTDDQLPAEYTISLRSRSLVYLLALGGYYGYIVGVVGLAEYDETLGVPGIIIMAVIVYPFGYLPLVVDFIVSFVTIHILLPRRIASLQPTPSFLDPRNLGGFHPLGRLFKRSYYLYTICLLLYLAYVYGPIVAPFMSPPVSRVGLQEEAFFTGAWVFGLGAIGHSLWTIHRLMVAEKERHLSQLEQRLHEAVEDPADISSASLYDNTDVENIQRQIETVRSMNEYPTTLGVTAQILSTILLPQLVRMLLEIPL